MPAWTPVRPSLRRTPGCPQNAEVSSHALCSCKGRILSTIALLVTGKYAEPMQRVCAEFRAAFMGRKKPWVAASSPQDLGMVPIAGALSLVSGKHIRHPQSSVSLRFEAATRMPEYLHTHTMQPAHNRVAADQNRKNNETRACCDGDRLPRGRRRLTVERPPLSCREQDARMPGYQCA